jgi:hypothetical protein
LSGEVMLAVCVSCIDSVVLRVLDGSLMGDLAFAVGFIDKGAILACRMCRMRPR